MQRETIADAAPPPKHQANLSEAIQDVETLRWRRVDLLFPKLS